MTPHLDFDRSLGPADVPQLDADLTDGLRERAYLLMTGHPIAATHLVLAAALIAPTCPAEQDVADYFTDLVADITIQLGIIHRRAVNRRRQRQSTKPDRGEQLS
jgi:hypothetical protein